ncbi:transglycosylase SLT domain-containing protein [Spirosoma areae]
MLTYEELVPIAYRAAFISKVRQVSARLGIDPNWLMIVMRVETAGTFSPAIRNYAGSGAVGLIQFTEIAIKGWGVTLDQLAKMSAVAQLDYVEKYLSPYASKIKDVYDLYLAVFAPAYLGRPDGQVLYSIHATTATGKRQYELNKVLDKNLDGSITIQEVKEAISRYVLPGVDTGSTPNYVLPILAAIGLLFLLNKRRNQ